MQIKGANSTSIPRPAPTTSLLLLLVDEVSDLPLRLLEAPSGAAQAVDEDQALQDQEPGQKHLDEQHGVEETQIRKTARNKKKIRNG